MRYARRTVFERGGLDHGAEVQRHLVDDRVHAHQVRKQRREGAEGEEEEGIERAPGER